MDPQQLKPCSARYFDFDAKSAVEAYLETVPPKAKEAIKDHQVSGGDESGNGDLRPRAAPPKKIREKDGEDEYEEWIYGEPPQDVDFVRFVGDEVTRVETMKVTARKSSVWREKSTTPKPTWPRARPNPRCVRPMRPRLRRPGEDLPTAPPADGNPASP